jgi:hypothetical protein
MSVLETPRIYFRGQVSWDPITTNNYSQRYDEFTGETVFPQVVDKVKAFRAQAIADVAGGGRRRQTGIGIRTALIAWAFTMRPCAVSIRVQAIAPMTPL